jgi:hypothetical protein
MVLSEGSRQCCSNRHPQFISPNQARKTLSTPKRPGWRECARRVTQLSRSFHAGPFAIAPRYPRSAPCRSGSVVTASYPSSCLHPSVTPHLHLQHHRRHTLYPSHPSNYSSLTPSKYSSSSTRHDFCPRKPHNLGDLITNFPHARRLKSLPRYELRLREGPTPDFFVTHLTERTRRLFNCATPTHLCNILTVHNSPRRKAEASHSSTSTFRLCVLVDGLVDFGGAVRPLPLRPPTAAKLRLATRTRNLCDSSQL